MNRERTDLHPEQPGFVSLVGAGPGSPELLTLRGLRALEQAEVVLHDALLDPGFAELFPAGAVILSVGKRCGGKGTSQERIHELLLGHARLGRRVVRLKGGDPFVFGRGGEEAQLLEAAGIPFEVIPGVSALQGAAAASGIPITHRGLSREVRILEGHHLLDGDTDWTELARTRATLAIFMGTRTLQRVALELLKHGASPELPVALVEQASLEGQSTTVGTLREAAEGGMCCRTEGPGLVYMGAAISARVHPVQPSSELRHADLSAAPALPGSPRPPRVAGGWWQRRAG